MLAGRVGKLLAPFQKKERTAGENREITDIY